MNYAKVTIIPQADRDEILIKEDNIIYPKSDMEFAVRAQGSLEGAGFFLNTAYDWIIAEDSSEALVLLKLHKEDQS